MGFDLKALQARKKLVIDEVRVSRSEIHETGEYDLEALFIRLGHAIDSIGAKRVVLDTLEALFGGFENTRRAALGVAAPFRLAQAEEGHRGHNRGARGGPAHPAGPGRVRLGLRHTARPSRGQSAHDPAAAHRQVPRERPRDRRISFSDRRERDLGPSHHFRRACASCFEQGVVERHRRARPRFGGRFLRFEHGARFRVLRERGKAPLPRTLSRAPARGEKARSTLRSSSPPTRSCATRRASGCRSALA